MQIEHVARIGLASGWAAQQQRHLAICHGLFRQIVIDDDGMHAVVSEELAHGAAGIGRQELQRGGLGRRGGHHDGMFHGAVVFQGLDDLGHGRTFLPDGDIDAEQLLGIVAAGVGGFLIEDGVDGHRRLAGLAIADDELALATADGHERVDGLESRLHRLVHRAARNDARRLDLDALALDVLQGALAINGVAQTVDHAPQQAAAHRRVDDGPGALHQVAFLDRAVIAEDHYADVVGLEVEGHAADAAGELDHLAGLDLVQAIDAGHAVAHGEHLADLGHIGLGAEIGDLLLQDGGDFCGADFHYPTPFMTNFRRCSLDFSELSTIRLPTLTIRPPMRLASVWVSIETLPPTARRSASVSAALWPSDKGAAEVTLAVTSPRRRASSDK